MRSEDFGKTAAISMYSPYRPVTIFPPGRGRAISFAGFLSFYHSRRPSASGVTILVQQ
jgi:hypothetical protein